MVYNLRIIINDEVIEIKDFDCDYLDKKFTNVIVDVNHRPISLGAFKDVEEFLWDNCKLIGEMSERDFDEHLKKTNLNIDKLHHIRNICREDIDNGTSNYIDRERHNYNVIQPFARDTFDSSLIRVTLASMLNRYITKIQPRLLDRIDYSIVFIDCDCLSEEQKTKFSKVVNGILPKKKRVSISMD